MFKQFLLKNKHLPIINPYSCGWQKCPPEHTPGLLVRDFWLIHYVVSGKGTYVEKGVPYRVNGGECFIIRPMETTTYVADRDDPWHYIWIGFETELDLSEYFTEPVMDGASVRDIFLSLTEIDRDRPHYEEHLAGKIFEMIMLISATERVPTKANDTVETAKHIMDTAYSTVTISALAETLHMSRAHLGKMFKEAEGITMKQYLQACRMRKAATFMKEMNMSPGQAGCAVGFTDVYSFSRAFKSYFNMTPTEFRNRASKNPSVVIKK